MILSFFLSGPVHSNALLGIWTIVHWPHHRFRNFIPVNSKALENAAAFGRHRNSHLCMCMWCECCEWRHRQFRKPAYLFSTLKCLHIGSEFKCKHFRCAYFDMQKTLFTLTRSTGYYHKDEEIKEREKKIQKKKRNNPMIVTRCAFSNDLRVDVYSREYSLVSTKR